MHTAEGAQETGIAAVAARKGEVGEQLGKALMEDGAILAAGFVAS